MKSWIFSDNEQTTPLMSGNEAIKYVEAHPNAYAWCPSYTHWIPVTHISEFSSAIKKPKIPSVIPKELIEQFVVKEKGLVDKLSILDTKIASAINSLTQFEAQVNFYKELTRDCNLDVQETLEHIEKQYARLQANLKSFTQTASVDKKSFENTASAFKNSVLGSATHDENNALEVIATVDNTEREPPAAITSLHTPSDPEDEQNPASALVKEMAQDKAYIRTESDTITIADESQPEKVKEEVNISAPFITSPTLNVVPERVVNKSLQVESAQGNKTQAALSELVEDVQTMKTSSVKDLQKVEFSENITAEDLAITAKIQSMTVDSTQVASYDKHDMENSNAGDFDYILSGKYVDDGSIGKRVDESEVEELVSDLDDEPKKKRRRRRR